MGSHIISHVDSHAGDPRHPADSGILNSCLYPVPDFLHDLGKVHNPSSCYLAHLHTQKLHLLPIRSDLCSKLSSWRENFPSYFRPYKTRTNNTAPRQKSLAYNHTLQQALLRVLSPSLPVTRCTRAPTEGGSHTAGLIAYKRLRRCRKMQTAPQFALASPTTGWLQASTIQG